MSYRIYDAQTNQLLETDAVPTPFMLSEWKYGQGPAVKRGKLWYAANFPGFEVQPGETVHRIQIREV